MHEAHIGSPLLFGSETVTRRGRGRWRDGRQTLSARRRARRTHRRDIPRGSYYEPIELDAAAARRGVNARLLAAVATLTATSCLILLALLAPGSRFVVTMLMSMAVGTLGAGVSLLLSARREEEVHRLASELQEMPQLPPGEVGADGTI